LSKNNMPRASRVLYDARTTLSRAPTNFLTIGSSLGACAGTNGQRRSQQVGSRTGDNIPMLLSRVKSDKRCIISTNFYPFLLP